MQTCQICGGVSCHVCGAAHRNCIVGDATTQDYVAAGLQDSRTAATLQPHDFQGHHRGSAAERSELSFHISNGNSAQNAASTPGKRAAAIPRTQALPDSVADWEGPASAAVGASPMLVDDEQAREQGEQPRTATRNEDGDDGYETGSDVGFPQARSAEGTRELQQFPKQLRLTLVRSRKPEEDRDMPDAAPVVPTFAPMRASRSQQVNAPWGDFPIVQQAPSCGLEGPPAGQGANAGKRRNINGHFLICGCNTACMKPV